LFHTNALGPILLAKALRQAFPKESRSFCVALSARLGSVSDNKLGGWYSYRASKAALNMLFHSYAIEVARTSQCIVSLYHPGTVATNGFGDYQTHVNNSMIIVPDRAAEGLWRYIMSATSLQSGKLIDYRGDNISF
jgi:NAD(P)-dependent dehydrogenase (short-subunit alcohol dehydrogenase family)